ncbi:hypothetical protein DOTSEDRAFT_136549, partial [Dothistroma septosporum NZE10]
RRNICFIASASLNGKHIDSSPKGQPSATLAIFSSALVGYLDATGLGIETFSHIHENGRARFTSRSFSKSPRIRGWFCEARVIQKEHPDYETY